MTHMDPMMDLVDPMDDLSGHTSIGNMYGPKMVHTSIGIMYGSPDPHA